MSYVNPDLRDAFESLSIDLKNEILSRNVQINTMDELKAAIERIIGD